jgi:ferredoxin
VPAPESVLLKRLDLIKLCQEVDVVISLPKLKTHNLTTITGAIKNLFGLVPGMTKTAYHAKLPDVDAFCDMLLDIAAHVRPALTVMDGVIGLEGSGPSTGGSPRQIGVLLAGSDVVAMDAVVCQIVGLDPAKLPLFRAAQRRGRWPVEFKVAGVPVAEIAVPDFRLPETARPVAGRSRLSSFAAKRTRLFVPFPAPQRERCTACRTCERVCPVQAISIVDRLAVVDHEACIRCYCCHEMCPEAAIDLQVSGLGRLLRWTGLLGRPV